MAKSPKFRQYFTTAKTLPQIQLPARVNSFQHYSELNSYLNFVSTVNESAPQHVLSLSTTSSIMTVLKIVATTQYFAFTSVGH